MFETPTTRNNGAAQRTQEYSESTSYNKNRVAAGTSERNWGKLIYDDSIDVGV